MIEYKEDINPKNYYGCVLDLDDNDKRLKDYQIQRKERGFDDTETWSLDVTIVNFILPRLKRLLEIEKKAFELDDEYVKDIEKSINLMENYESTFPLKSDLSVFFKHFGKLWW